MENVLYLYDSTAIQIMVSDSSPSDSLISESASESDSDSLSSVIVVMRCCDRNVGRAGRVYRVGEHMPFVILQPCCRGDGGASGCMKFKKMNT